MQTVWCDYYATGEGRSIMVMVINGKGEEGKANALKRFSDRFDPYFALGAEVRDGLYFDFDCADLLFSERMKETLSRWDSGDGAPGSVVFASSIHFNFG